MKPRRRRVPLVPPFVARHRGALAGAIALLLAVSPAAVPRAARAAGPVFWDYPEAARFGTFDLAGVGLDAHARLAPGLAAAEVALGGPEIVWCLAPDGKGGVDAATGHDGQIWRVTRDGTPRLLTTLPEPEIFTLARVDGQLYAAGGPDGLVFRVDEGGRYEGWADLPEEYVWSLAAAGGGRLYAGVGSPAAVYRIDGRLAVTRLAQLPATHVMDLAVTAQGRLLVLTQGPGLIWELDPEQPQSPRVLFETPQDEARQLVAGPDGAWYALAISHAGEPAAPEPLAPGPVGAAEPDTDGTTGRDDRRPLRPQPDFSAGALLAAAPGTERAALYRIAADGVVTLTWGGNAPVVSVAYAPRWGWLGVGAHDGSRGVSAVWALNGESAARPLATWEGGDAIDLLVSGEEKDPAAWVAQARPGRLMTLTSRPAEAAVAVSPPIDGKVPIRWSRLRWEGETSGGARVRFSVRGGPRAAPDATWSAWSEPWSEADHAIPLPPSRFLQWRVEFTGAGAAAAVEAVTVSGYEPNVTPRIARFELQPPGSLTTGGPFDGGSVTEAFPGGLKAEYSVDSRQDRRADPLAASRVRAVRSFLWQAWDPNDDRLTFTLAYRRLGERAWRPIGDETVETVRAWDTAGVPDGVYELRLTASDRRDNRPDEALTAERVSAPLRVDNTPPEVTGWRVARTAEGLQVSCRAADLASPLAEAWVELPDGELVRLDPRDGVCDSLTEEFAASYAFPRAGRAAPPPPWRVRMGVVDRAGNVGRAEGEAE